MKSAHSVILRPHITEKTVSLSVGDPRIKEESEVTRKYTFVVARDANKIDIKRSIEEIYNAGKKKGEFITVTSVATVTVKGKTRRVGQRAPGKKSDWKKAVITLAKGQMLEDYGV